MAPNADAELRIDALGSMDTSTTGTDDKERIDSPSAYSDKAPSISAYDVVEGRVARRRL